MASNFFTKPAGLHPTPSACFPPPPPPNPKTFKGFLSVTPITAPALSPAFIKWLISDTRWAPGTPLAAHWTHPGLTFAPALHVLNGIREESGCVRDFNLGNFTGKLKVTFPDNSVRTVSCFYQNT